MEINKARKEDIRLIYDLVQDTIKNTYSKYYPIEVVDFFCKHHSEENILRDIEKGYVDIFLVDGKLVGTGSCEGNHITRVFVLPEYQGRGYGSFIMQHLEELVAKEYTHAQLDASLAASHMYEKRGYVTLSHERIQVENGAVLVYEIMEKELSKVREDFFYDGKHFVAVSNTENGEVDSSTMFEYYQKDHVVWANYSGKDIIKGDLLGTVDDKGELDFYYQHINVNNEVRIGKCHSIPEVLEDGRLRLKEEWQWLNGDMSKGSSMLEESIKR